MRNHPILIVCTMLGLTGCEPSREEPPAKPPAPVSETVFDPAVGAMNKARSVEGVLQQDRDNTNAAIEATH